MTSFILYLTYVRYNINDRFFEDTATLYTSLCTEYLLKCKYRYSIVGTSYWVYGDENNSSLEVFMAKEKSDVVGVQTDETLSTPGPSLCPRDDTSHLSDRRQSGGRQEPSLVLFSFWRYSPRKSKLSRVLAVL